jgi:hypothetical protein
MKMTRKRKTAVVTIVLVVAGFAGCFVSALNRARFEARQTMCVHNLKLLGLPLKMYAEKHDGAFPDKWSTLISDPDLFSSDMLELFVCPMHSKRYEKEHGVPYTVSGRDDVDECSSYVLVPGLHMTDDKDTILAYEKGDNHGGIGHSVLYLDTRGGWDPPSNYP